VNLKRTLLAFIASIAVFGCTDISALRNHEKAGEARYDCIPLASRGEHEQAQRFVPLNRDNCLLYVVRKTDWYTGASVDKAKVLVTPAESPLSPPELFSHYKFEVAEITATKFVGNVYAMWELPPKVYRVTAIFSRNYAQFVAGWKRDLFEKSRQPGAELNWFQRHQLDLYMAYFAQAEIDCRPGAVQFIAVGDRGLNMKIVLEELTEEEGRTFVHNGVRSLSPRP
jgi:hypothetical protein